MKPSYKSYENYDEAEMALDNFDNQISPRNGKRKSVEESSSYCSLEENIKRCKITNTPGELRLQTDLKAVSLLRGVNIEVVSPGSVVIVFDDDETRCLSPIPSACVVNNFLVTVPRYYPHSPPSVKCLDVLNNKRKASPRSPHGVDSVLPCCYLNNVTGDVVHPGLTNEWTALCSLKTILDILHFIRLSSINS